MNGKRNSWEAVNILPFIDANRLKQAVKALCPPSCLTAEEMERNKMGKVRKKTGKSDGCCSAVPERLRHGSCLTVFAGVMCT